MSHNGKDKQLVIDLSERLKRRGLRVWLDIWQLRPGLSWQEGLLNGLGSSDSCAVLIGPSGYGGWHRREVEVALQRQGVNYPVIPVLLPGAPDRIDIGAFLSSLTWVDFRQGLNDSPGLERLVWGITGLSQGDYTNNHNPSVDRFVIESPRNGDLLTGPQLVSGTGPPGESVFLHYRLPASETFDDSFYLSGETETNEAGRWELRWFGPAAYFGLPGVVRPGAYEVYAAGVQGAFRSQLVTIFYQDATNVHSVLQKRHRESEVIELFYELRTAFLEATKLRTGRMVFSDRIVGGVSEIEDVASRAGQSIASELIKLIPRLPLRISISITPKGRVRLQPRSAWACYYAFPAHAPYGVQPGNDLAALQTMRLSQQSWRMSSHISRIPSRPFGEGMEAGNEYLEVRHEGYRPEFIPLDRPARHSIELKLSPVLEKRVAVLEFPQIGSEERIDGASQLIVGEIARALERTPELSTYGYLAERTTRPPTDFFESMGRPSIEVGNEILTLDDVRSVEEQLELVDTKMISGEGRFLKRRELDINFVIRGSYRILSARLASES